MHKLIRITTIPISLEKLLEGQLTYMNNFYEVRAVSAEKDRLEKYGRENGINTYWVEMTRAITPLKDLQAVARLYRYFKKEKPLIVHTHTPKAGIVGMLAAKLAGVPVRLHTVAGLPLLESNGIKRKILERVEKATYSLATNIYPNSEGLKEIILDHGFVNPKKLKILGSGSSNGIDTRYFNPIKFSASENQKFKKSLSIPPQDLVFIFVGRVVKDKGINELVSAFVEVQKIKKNISLLIVGPFEQDLNPVEDKTVEQINLHSKIFYQGYQDDVRPYFAISEVLVFPSYREGFPNVVLQAGAMEVPSIVSNINGCNEIIKHRKNGLIIKAKSQMGIQKALFQMIDNPEMRKKFSQNSRKRITLKYERNLIWQNLLNEYRTLEHNLYKEGKKKC